MYREFAARGQIEISTTPFYHPILPLLCDSDIAEVAHPDVPLPSRFRYPQDARINWNARAVYMDDRIGCIRGCGPRKDRFPTKRCIWRRTGFKWFATDNGVLGRTLGRSLDVGHLSTVPLEAGRARDARMFRDHYLSDLIGFVYSRMGAEEAAGHFLDRIRENCGRFCTAEMTH